MKFKAGDYIKYVGNPRWQRQDDVKRFESELMYIKAIRIIKAYEAIDYGYILHISYIDGYESIYAPDETWYKGFVDETFVKVSRKLKLERLLV